MWKHPNNFSVYRLSFSPFHCQTEPTVCTLLLLDEIILLLLLLPIVHFPVRTRPTKSSLSASQSRRRRRLHSVTSWPHWTWALSPILWDIQILFRLFWQKPVTLSLISPLVARFVLSSSLPFSGHRPSSQDNSQCNSPSKDSQNQKGFPEFSWCVYGPPSPLF